MTLYDSTRMRMLERELAVDLSRQTGGGLPPVFCPATNQYEGWVICPRARAQRLGWRVLEIADETRRAELLAAGEEIYGQLQRFHASDDLVFAIADIQ